MTRTRLSASRPKRRLALESARSARLLAVVRRPALGVVGLALAPLLAAAALGATACAGAPRRPTLPPPEYEEPSGPADATDSGAPSGRQPDEEEPGRERG